MRQSRKRIIGSGLIKAVEAAARKEDALRGRMMFRDQKWKRRLENLRIKFLDLRDLVKHLRKENRRLRRAVHYLEHLNGGITERQTTKLEKVLGLPASITRTDDWHKVAADGWDYIK